MPQPEAFTTQDRGFETVENYKEALVKLSHSQHALFYAEVVLRHRRDAVIRDAADPKTLGANEAARDAALRYMTEAEQRRVDDLNLELILDRGAVETARLSWEFAKFSLRVSELSALPEKEQHGGHNGV